MKKLLSGLALTFISVPLFADIIQNGGFENTKPCSGDWSSSDDCPTGFYGYLPDASKVTMKTQDDGDNKVVKVTIAQSDNQYTRAGFSQTKSTSVAGKKYRFSILVKPEDFRGQTRLQFIERDGSGAASTFEVSGPAGGGAWQRLTAVKTMDASTASVQFNVMTSTSGVLCPSGACGSVLYDNVSVEEISGADPVAGIGNPCGDGYFLNPSDRQCQLLDKTFGFDEAQFALGQKSLVVSSASGGICSTAGFKNAVLQVKNNGGGTIVLPECTITLNAEVYLPSNTVIQGAGTGRTRIYISDANWDGRRIAVFGAEKEGDYQSHEISNIIIRDLSFSYAATPIEPIGFINVSGSENVLLERLDLDGGSRSNINILESQKVTVRYVNSRNTVNSGNHGIGSKDCFPDEEMDQDANGSISRSECDGGDPLFWTDNVSIHSSWSSNNSTGLDFHGSHAEIAGNVIDGNDYGAKFPEPSRALWIHDNIVQNNVGFGFDSKTQYTDASESIHVDASMKSGRHAYYRNKILNNGYGRQDIEPHIAPQYGFRVDKTENVVLIDNQYLGNNQNELRVNDDSYDFDPNSTPKTAFFATVYYCPNDEVGESAMSYDVNKKVFSLYGYSVCSSSDFSSLLDETDGVLDILNE